MNPRPARLWRPDPQPLRWPLPALLLPMVLGWGVALLATLTIPDLHSGERSWWPWCCVAALVLGGLGYVHLRRGRGNAAHA